MDRRDREKKLGKVSSLDTRSGAWTVCLMPMKEAGSLFAILLGIFISALMVSGCSSTTLTSGANLAKAGQTVANQMEQNATLSSDAMLNLRQAVAFNDGFNGQAGNSSSATFLNNVQQIQDNLSQYARMLESLSAVYAALGDLATYDAVGSFNTSFANLAKDSNQFLQGIHSGVQVGPVTTSAVKAGGGILLGFVQAKDVKDASRSIRLVLQTVIPVLDDQRTRQLLILNKQQVTGQVDQAAETLFFSGVYSYDPLLDALGAPMNFKSNPQSASVVAKNAKLERGLRNVVIETASEQSDQIADSYDKSVAALKALIPLHESLENGAPVNVGTLSVLVTQLETIATSLESAKGK